MGDLPGLKRNPHPIVLGVGQHDRWVYLSFLGAEPLGQQGPELIRGHTIIGTEVLDEAVEVPS